MSQPAVGGEGPASLITVGAPEGFADLSGPQQLIVDVYYNGVRLGRTQISASPGAFRFEQPGEVAAIIPGLRASAELIERFRRSLPANEGLVCGEGADPARCGRLDPGDVGAILDRDRFRLDLFFGERLANAFERPSHYLAMPEGSFSMLHSLAAIASGATGGTTELSLQDRFILASGNKRFKGDLFFSRRDGLQADQAFAELDANDWRYAAGLLSLPGSDMIVRRKLIGVGIASQFDTRLDHETLLGSPLFVSLAARARVEVVRDGRILTSQILGPGNHRLETAAFPEGAYDVALRISETGAPAREETRLFTKSARVAPVGRDLAFVYAGMAARENARRIVSISDQPYLLAGYAHRLSEQLAADLTVAATDQAVVAQLGGNVFLGDARLGIAGLGSSTGGYGGLVQFGYHDGGPLSASFDLRSIRLAHGAAIDGLALDGPTRANSLADAIPALRAGTTSFTQLTGFAGYGRANRQFGLSFSARKQDDEPLAYSVGPTVRWDIVQRGPLRLSFNADGGFTERGHTGFVGLSLNLFSGLGNSSSRAGLRYSALDGEPDRVRPVISVYSARQLGNVAGGTLELGAGFDNDSARELVNLSGRLQGDRVVVNSDVVKDLGGGTQYALALRSTLAVADGKLAAQGANQNQAALVVRVTGGRRGDSYEVLINDAPVATITAGATASVQLAPYKEYLVRLRPKGDRAMAFDSRERRVSVFPGTVASLEWSSMPLARMFGRLTSASGEPARFALIRSGDAIGEADENGYFQIEAAPGAELTARLGDGAECTGRLPEASRDETFAMVGTLVCRPGIVSDTQLAQRDGENPDD